MCRTLAALAGSCGPHPLIGEIYSSDPEAELPVVFVSCDTVDDRTVEAIKDIRAASEEVDLVVFYSGDDPAQEIPALEAGADDCIRVDLDYRYVGARLRASVARLCRTNLLRPPTQTLDLDLLTHQAVVGERRFALSPLEFRFLSELRRQRGRVVPHEHLERLLWGDAGTCSRESLKHVVCRLRRRLGDQGHAIAAVPGVGYILGVFPHAGAVTSRSPE